MNRYNYDNKIGMYADDNGEWCRVDDADDKHIGSSFDEFLEEQGIKQEVEITARDIMIESQQQTIENLKSENEWISVEDRLPEIYLGVLVWSVDEVFIADRYPDCYRCNGEPISNVTHWQPLPEPPKENI